MDSCNNKREIPRQYLPTGDSFSAHNNIRITAVYTDGSAEGELTVTPQSLNPHGIVHGGCLATLADTVGGWAASASRFRNCVTVNYAFNFLRPAKGTNRKIYCEAVPEKLGATLCVYRLTLTDDEGVEVANGNFTFFLMDSRPELPEGVRPEDLKALFGG